MKNYKHNFTLAKKLTEAFYKFVKENNINLQSASGNELTEYNYYRGAAREFFKQANLKSFELSEARELHSNVYRGFVVVPYFFVDKLSNYFFLPCDVERFLKEQN